MISKEMLKRCQNELKQVFCALPDDVQKSLSEYRAYIRLIDSAGRWIDRPKKADDVFYPAAVYGLSPDTPADPEWYEISIRPCGNAYEVVLPCSSFGSELQRVLSRTSFLGIIYRKDGIETLRTSIDAAFGTPVRVRFSKP